MKISIGFNLQKGPWGGGNQFGHSLTDFLRKKQIDVSFDLKQPDLDIALLVEPRSSAAISAFSHLDIYRYLLIKNKKALVLHRINECDERKGTTNVNNIIMGANQIADYTIFISKWLQNLYAKLGMDICNSGIIYNGANKTIFNSENYKTWDGKEKLRIVTHHWGASVLKGFDIYKTLDQLLNLPDYSTRFDFTYIGNIPQNICFSNTKCISPLYAHALAASLQSNHVYLTASQNEPAGMHHIEGASCGLPILFRMSGALPEYCEGFGIGFDSQNFVEELEEMYQTYNIWQQKMIYYPFDAQKMCQQYYDLFIELLDHREEIISKRNLQLNPSLLLSSLFSTRFIHRLRGKVRQWIK